MNQTLEIPLLSDDDEDLTFNDAQNLALSLSLSHHHSSPSSPSSHINNTNNTNNQTTTSNIPLGKTSSQDDTNNNNNNMIKSTTSTTRSLPRSLMDIFPDHKPRRTTTVAQKMKKSSSSSSSPLNDNDITIPTTSTNSSSSKSSSNFTKPKFKVMSPSSSQSSSSSTTTTTTSDDNNDTKLNKKKSSLVTQQVQDEKFMKRVLFTVSGIGPERAQLRDTASKYGAKYSNDYTRAVTHVVVANDRPLLTSDKVKSAIKDGKIVVKQSWIEDCHRAGKLLPEIKYTVGSASGNDDKRRNRKFLAGSDDDEEDDDDDDEEEEEDRVSSKRGKKRSMIDNIAGEDEIDDWSDDGDDGDDDEDDGWRPGLASDDEDYVPPSKVAKRFDRRVKSSSNDDRKKTMNNKHKNDSSAVQSSLSSSSSGFSLASFKTKSSQIQEQKPFLSDSDNTDIEDDGDSKMMNTSASASSSFKNNHTSLADQQPSDDNNDNDDTQVMDPVELDTKPVQSSSSSASSSFVPSNFVPLSQGNQNRRGSSTTSTNNNNNNTNTSAYEWLADIFNEPIMQKFYESYNAEDGLKSRTKFVPFVRETFDRAYKSVSNTGRLDGFYDEWEYAISLPRCIIRLNRELSSDKDKMLQYIPILKQVCLKIASNLSGEKLEEEPKPVAAHVASPNKNLSSIFTGLHFHLSDMLSRDEKRSLMRSIVAGDGDVHGDFEKSKDIVTHIIAPGDANPAQIRSAYQNTGAKILEPLFVQQCVRRKKIVDADPFLLLD